MPEQPELPTVTPREAARDLVGRAPSGAAYWCAVVALGALAGPAAARGRRGGPAGRAAPGWGGRLRRWDVAGLGVKALGALYLLLFTYVNLLVSGDLALSLVPHWSSAVIPPYHVVSGFE